MEKIENLYDTVLIDPNEDLVLLDKTLVQHDSNLIKFIYAICCFDYENLPVALTRIEEFANALITGELPDIEPQSRSEQFFKAILTGDISTLPDPQSRGEVLLDKIARGNDDLSDIEPIQSRYELLLAYLIKNGGSLPNLTYVFYQFQETAATFQNTKEKPYKSLSIKGQTYQNILPEPTTPVLTNNAEMFSVDEGLDETIEIVDGVAKSAILSGNTLVNLSNMPQEVETMSQIAFPIVNIKPNTQYTILYQIKSSNELTPVNVSSMFRIENIIDSNGNSLNVIYGHTDTIKTNYSFKKVVVTSRTDTVGMRINVRNAFQDNGLVENTLFIKDLIILEGDYTNADIPYFEGMKSVKMPVLTTTGKNLFDKSKTLENCALEGTSNVVLEGWKDYFVSDYIPVKKNEPIFIPYTGSSRKIYCDKNKEYVRQITNSDSYFTPEFDGFIRLTFINVDLNTYQLEYNTQATSYEPFKSNILTVNEGVTLRGIGDVRDELDLLTGEVVERIGEYSLTGDNEKWTIRNDINIEGYVYFQMELNDVILSEDSGICDKLPYDNRTHIPMEQIRLSAYMGKTLIGVRLSKSRGITKINEFVEYLKSNPIKFQYPLATPTIKTVDLSSSGNWEKIVFDGSDDEGWAVHTSTSNLTNCLHLYCKVENLMKNTTPFSNFFQGNVYGESVSSDDEGIMVGGSYHIHINILKSRLDSNEVAGFKQWLSQNPITVWYQTTTTLDSTQVKQPIFFKDGHIQLSSGADHSLIPTLDYQAKTSNSYVMDLMKTNTIYTMKSSTHNGGYIYIDGKDYTMGLNRQFTSPSSMTNKLLVVDGVIDNFMILEGNLTSKDVPYFKGIKSAFENEDKIEVLSTNNLENTDENYQSNTVIIPLSQPLISISDEIRDEIEIDLSNKKAVITQRIELDDATNEYIQLENPIVEEVDIVVTDQDGNEIPKPKSYDEVTHFSINSLIPPIVEVEVQTSNQEDLETLSDTIDEIENQQDQLMTTSEEQEDGVQSAMLGLTEVFEESEEL